MNSFELTKYASVTDDDVILLKYGTRDSFDRVYKDTYNDLLYLFEPKLLARIGKDNMIDKGIFTQLFSKGIFENNFNNDAPIRYTWLLQKKHVPLDKLTANLKKVVGDVYDYIKNIIMLIRLDKSKNTILDDIYRYIKNIWLCAVYMKFSTNDEASFSLLLTNNDFDFDLLFKSDNDKKIYDQMNIFTNFIYVKIIIYPYCINGLNNELLLKGGILIEINDEMDD